MLAYPGNINGVWIDKNALNKALNPIIEFQKKYGAKIYCGEFSVIRWAPGAEFWLRDVLELLEKNQWNWTYHAYRECMAGALNMMNSGIT